MFELLYTTKSGSIMRKMIQITAVLEIEDDPRQGVLSKSIVKLSNGDKYYSTHTYEELQQKIMKGERK